MDSLILKPKEDRRIRNGHLWVFSNEIKKPPKGAGPGSIVSVYASGGRYLGNAVYHPHSLISARMLGKNVVELNREFFVERIEAAALFRRRLWNESNCYRLVHGESDRLPGLIIDRFEDYYVIQALTTAIDQKQKLICEILQELFNPAGIFERNDSALRDYEALEKRKGLLFGNSDGHVEIEENGIRFGVNLLEGQKTGFFLDQKLNRRAITRYAEARAVLDCFANVGGFALNAAKAEAKRVVGVDSSKYAICAATENARLNGLKNVDFVLNDVFDFMKGCLSSRETYDMIILDPPSFAPRKKDIPVAKRGYRKLNQLAISLLSEGGILATASCSYHLTEESFYRLVSEAAVQSGKRLQLLEQRQQSPDHPILVGMPETRYLKFGIFRVL